MIGRNRVYTLLFATVMGLLTIGCSGEPSDDLPREAVAGKVTMDGQALPKGNIVFSPMGDGQSSATGQIENGEFAIPRERGLVPGDYKVSISHTDQPEGHVKIEVKKRGQKAPAGFKELIPAKYNAKTDLKATIPKGGKSDLEFPLQSK